MIVVGQLKAASVGDGGERSRGKTHRPRRILFTTTSLLRAGEPPKLPKATHPVEKTVPVSGR
jgi:hypothetical protein